MQEYLLAEMMEAGGSILGVVEATCGGRWCRRIGEENV